VTVVASYWVAVTMPPNLCRTYTTAKSALSRSCAPVQIDQQLRVSAVTAVFGF
jgi:hypothetical protein